MVNQGGPSMQYTLGGLVLATFFGMFFGSEGEMDPGLFDLIFWGFIWGGALLNFLALVKEKICRSCHCYFCHGI